MWIRSFEPSSATLAVDLRLDVAMVEDDLPSYDEGTANRLWNVVEQQALSPLLTMLTTDRSCTLDSLASAARLPSELVNPILTSLKARGWVSQSNIGDSATFQLKDDGAYVIGVSVDATSVVGVLQNLRGVELANSTVPLVGLTRDDVIGAIVELASNLYGQRTDREILGVGVTISGVVTETGTVEFAPDLAGLGDGWRHVPLEQEVQERLQIRVGDHHLLVAVENDANAFAMKEYLDAGDSCVVVVLLSASGRGIGIGAVVEGTVVYGEENAAGEGGHIVVDPKGDRCRTDEHNGCLETVASAHGILGRLSIENGSPTAIKEGLVVVNDRVRRGDSDAVGVVVEAGRWLGSFLATTMALYNPSHITIFGDSVLVDADSREAAKIFRESVVIGLESALSDKRWSDGRLRWKPLSKHAEATAAAAAAMHYFLEHPGHWRPSVLTPRTPVNAPV